MTEIVNIRNQKPDVYCGRGSIFGNPYTIGIDGDRETVIKRYKDWFNFCLRDSIFKNEVLKLKDKTLGCFCVPQKCHLEIIKEYLDNLE